PGRGSRTGYEARTNRPERPIVAALARARDAGHATGGRGPRARDGAPLDGARAGGRATHPARPARFDRYAPRGARPDADRGGRGRRGVTPGGGADHGGPHPWCPMSRDSRRGPPGAARAATRHRPPAGRIPERPALKPEPRAITPGARCYDPLRCGLPGGLAPWNTSRFFAL